MFYKCFTLLFSIFLLHVSVGADTLATPQNKFFFQEIWGYLFKGEEKYFKGSEPITDIAYFSAEVNEVGRLAVIPDIAKIPAAIRTNRRVHLVISAPHNRSLMYFCLSSDTGSRKNLIEDIVKAAKPFHGVQIDFEAIRPDDREKYWEFLQNVKSALPKETILSVALPARLKESTDAFTYSKIAPIVDKVCVMAYDEHYDGSEPGSIACSQWCEKITIYAKNVIPPAKLIMCIPLYGRVWAKQKVARSIRYEQVLELQKECFSVLQRDADETPHFTYQKPVDAIVYFEDVRSLSHKLRMYQRSQIQSVGFWRIGQGPAALWEHLSHEKK